MGDVLSVIRVMPTGPDVDLDRLQAKIEELEPHTIAKKPVAFGLNCLEVQFIRPDSEGGTDKLEEKIRAMEGVQSVEVTGVTLI